MGAGKDSNQRLPNKQSCCPPIWEQAMNPIKTTTNQTRNGFSMPEVLVSSALLAFIVASSTQLYVNSGKTIQRGSARDAVYARIADDLEELRRESWRWACEDGTACTGRADQSDIPVAYKTGRKCTTAPCPAGELLQIPELSNACLTKTTAAYMAAHHTVDNILVFPIASSPTILSWTKNLPSGTAASAQTNGINIERRIKLHENDGNQLDVTYNTSSGSPVSVTLNAALTPQALSWCP
jgi:Tfp pilus assembly protein PilV